MIRIQDMKLLGLKKRGLMGYSYLLQSPADGENVIENLDDLYEAAKLSRDIGCDYFEVKPSYAWRGDTPHALMVHKKNYLELAKEKLAEIEELETESFHILHAINLKYSLDGVQAQQVKQYDVCPSAQLRTLITPKGVYVCPYWRGKKRFKLGDINNMRLAEIWQSENKKKVMKNLDPSRDCQFHCLRHDTNNVAIDIKKNIENMPSEENNNNSEEFDRFI